MLPGELLRSTRDDLRSTSKWRFKYGSHLSLNIIFPCAFAFIIGIALVDVKKALRAHRRSPLDGPTFDVLKRKKGEQK